MREEILPNDGSLELDSNTRSALASEIQTAITKKQKVKIYLDFFSMIFVHVDAFYEKNKEIPIHSHYQTKRINLSLIRELAALLATHGKENIVFEILYPPPNPSLYELPFLAITADEMREFLSPENLNERKIVDLLNLFFDALQNEYQKIRREKWQIEMSGKLLEECRERCLAKAINAEYREYQKWVETLKIAEEDQQALLNKKEASLTHYRLTPKEESIAQKNCSALLETAWQRKLQKEDLFLHLKPEDYLPPHRFEELFCTVIKAEKTQKKETAIVTTQYREPQAQHHLAQEENDDTLVEPIIVVSKTYPWTERDTELNRTISKNYYQTTEAARRKIEHEFATKIMEEFEDAFPCTYTVYTTWEIRLSKTQFIKHRIITNFSNKPHFFNIYFCHNSDPIPRSEIIKLPAVVIGVGPKPQTAEPASYIPQGGRVDGGFAERDRQTRRVMKIISNHLFPQSSSSLAIYHSQQAERGDPLQDLRAARHRMEEMGRIAINPTRNQGGFSSKNSTLLDTQSFRLEEQKPQTVSRCKIPGSPLCSVSNSTSSSGGVAGSASTDSSSGGLVAAISGSTSGASSSGGIAISNRRNDGPHCAPFLSAEQPTKSGAITWVHDWKNASPASTAGVSGLFPAADDNDAHSLDKGKATSNRRNTLLSARRFP